MTTPDEAPAFDIVIVGAGFGGLCALHKCRQLGKRAAVFEAAPDVGGTWYWNSYPGARCDVESLGYNFSFDADLKREYQSKWPERFSAQPVILEYARHVADRYALRTDIRFKTRVTRAIWAEDRRFWIVETDRGDQITARFLVSAVGCLSSAQVPSLEGSDTFEGSWHHTGNWPKDGVNFETKHVLLIGTGSTGVQAAPIIAESAARLTVLQRTPHYAAPARNYALTRENLEREIQRVANFYAARYPADGDPPISWHGMNTVMTFDDPPESRQRRFEQLWERGGAGFFLAYKDTMTDLKANNEVSEFVRTMIRFAVKDPATAAKLLPTYPIGTKRMIAETNYYEMYNRPNVYLEDIRSDPIERVTAHGIRLKSGHEIEADILVFATGYDALTGSILRLNIEGVGGLPLMSAWEAGPRTLLGLAVHGFPNFFMITGPQSPSVLSNVIYSIEQHVDWLGELFQFLDARGFDRVEASLSAQDHWVSYCASLANQTLYQHTDSWYMGANIPGKPRTFLPFVGGNVLYKRRLDEVRDENYTRFALSSSTVDSSARAS